MSAYRRYSCQIMNEDLLIKTLEELKYSVSKSTTSKNIHVTKKDSFVNFTFNWNKKREAFDIVGTDESLRYANIDEITQTYSKNRIVNEFKVEMPDYSVVETGENIRIVGRRII